MVADDDDHELGVVVAGIGEDAQLRPGLSGDERAQCAADARPATGDGLGHFATPEEE